jgi:transcriptional regulator of acetoin/glycerol metabolism
VRRGRDLAVVLTDVVDKRESPRRVRVVEARTAKETLVAHRTARLNEYGRLLLATRVIDEGWTVSTAADAQGVSRATGHKWVRR